MSLRATCILYYGPSGLYFVLCPLIKALVLCVVAPCGQAGPGLSKKLLSRIFGLICQNHNLLEYLHLNSLGSVPYSHEGCVSGGGRDAMIPT